MDERETTRDLINKVLSETCDNAAITERIAKDIERACYNTTIKECLIKGVERNFTCNKFLYIYSSYCYDILHNFNICPEFSTQLITRIINGEIDAKKITTYSNEELIPEATREIREKLKLRQEQKIQVKYSKLYTCRKCGSKKTQLKEYQGSLGLDEPMRYLITCAECKNKWTM